MQTTHHHSSALLILLVVRNVRTLFSKRGIAGAVAATLRDMTCALKFFLRRVVFEYFDWNDCFDYRAVSNKDNYIV